MAGPRHATLSRHSATLNGCPSSSTKARRSAPPRSARPANTKKRWTARRVNARRVRRRRTGPRQSPISRTRGRRRETRFLRQHYRVEPGAEPGKELTRRRELAAEFGFSGGNLPTAGLDFKKWNNGEAEIVGGHHKLPKRTLGFLYDKMTDPQRVKMRGRLNLDPGAGHKALARLRSNIIPRGPLQVAPEMRADDPDATPGGMVSEGVDAVIDKSGSMTPRSRKYVSLAAHAKQIHDRLTAVAAAKMSDEEADTAVDHLHSAEALHHSMEGGPQAADDAQVLASGREGQIHG